MSVTGGPSKKQDSIFSEYKPEVEMDVFRYARKVSIVLTLGIIFNVAFALGFTGLAWYLVTIFNKAPQVVQEDYGKVTYYPAKPFRMKTKYIEAFLTKTVGDLLSYNQDGYKYTHLKPFVAPFIIKMFEKTQKDNFLSTIKFNRRQLWRLSEIRRYRDRKFPGFIGIAVRGEKVNYEDKRDKDRENYLEVESERDPSFLVAYLKPVPITRRNPWGLKLAGMEEKAKETKFYDVWEASYDPDSTRRFSWSLRWRPPKNQEAEE